MITDTTRFMRMLGLLESARPPPRAKRPGPGVVIGHKEDGEPVVLSTPGWSSAHHVFVCAGTGTGKSVLISNAIALEFIASLANLPVEQQTSYVIVDPKGDLAKHVGEALGAMAPSALTRLTILDPFSVAGFQFNLNKLASHVPCDIRAMQLADLVGQVSTGPGGQGVGHRQVDVLQHLLLGALAVDRDGASPLLALDALVQPGGFEQLAALTGSTRAKDFLRSTKLSGELQASTLSRLRTAFAATEQLERLTSSRGCIDIEALCGPGRIVILDLGQPPGGLAILVKFWGNLVLRQFADQLISRRSPWTGHHTRLVIDEAQILVPVLSDLAEITLTTGRSRGISLVTMTQTLSLLQRESQALVQCLEANVPCKLVGRVAAADADLISRELASVPDSTEPRSKVRERFTSSVTNLKDRSFFALGPGVADQFKAVSVDTGAWRDGSLTHQQALAAARERFAVEGTSKRIRLSDLAQPVATPRAAAKAEDAPRQRPRSRWG